MEKRQPKSSANTKSKLVNIYFFSSNLLLIKADFFTNY